EHYGGVAYKQVGAFADRLRQDGSIMARCLEFITLTAARLSEATHAAWDEIDPEGGVWPIPAWRMKSGKEHKVPLSAAVLAVLKKMPAVRHSDYIFAGYRAGRPLGQHGLGMLAKRAADAAVRNL